MPSVISRNIFVQLFFIKVDKKKLLKYNWLIFCLFQKFGKKDLPVPPPRKGNTLIVPFGVRPKLQRTAVEFLIWGVRNLASYRLQAVNNPRVIVQVKFSIFIGYILLLMLVSKKSRMNALYIPAVYIMVGRIWSKIIFIVRAKKTCRLT